MSLTEQCVSEDRALAKVCGGSGTKQIVIEMLLRAGGKTQKGNSGQLFGVAAEVRGDAEMAGEVERALSVPSVEVVATEAAAKTAAKVAAKTAAEAVAGVKQGVSAIDSSARRNVFTAL